ncbi:SDR family NAD(P)-dependent oxidoreductase [Oculatella sp. FACHB-28]|uniref:SDR family oxidoreductase n=1 Tax=Cyanophyceae TaxID=3028117 RepID=UPI001688444D|nr:MULTISPECIES: SDR family oxidoreductase [Cyanophyceae]MBD1997579.1 SDR family NAD(P)-dependent oxidoreductase [Leptolyngbya sp. FACHB-541]MBD2060650.1 SDR family NAD(P)-dependent oxidoreductase [Oculatella sp. FACHB-28]
MTIKLKPIHDQVVVIFGASSGMGRATAKLLGAKGAKVVAAARGAEGLTSLKAEIEAEGGTCVTQVADVSAFEQVKDVADLAVERFERIDTWVGVAGVWATASFEETKPEELYRIIQVNLFGQAHGLWAALPHLKRNIARGEPGGAIICFSSVLGQLGHPMTSAYCASKHGLNGMIDALRIELQQQNVPISLTTIMPFGTNTPIYDTGLSRIGFTPRPAPPIVQPEVVAEAVVYAAEHPVRQVYGSGIAKALVMVNQLVPELMDDFMAVNLTPEKQKSKKQIAASEPNGLYVPVADWRVHGDFDDESIERSPYVLLQTGQDVSDGISEIEGTLNSVLTSDGAKVRGIDSDAVLPVLRDLAMGQAHRWIKPTVGAAQP